MPILPDRLPPVRPEFSAVDFWNDPDIVRLADLLAWLNDSADNSVEDYPGPGWDKPDRWPAWTDAEVWSPGVGY